MDLENYKKEYHARRERISKFLIEMQGIAKPTKEDIDKWSEAPMNF